MAMRRVWIWLLVMTIDVAILNYFRWSKMLAPVTRIENLLVTGYQQFDSSTGPTIKTTTTNPDGVATEPKGSLKLNTSTATVYQNINGATTWFDLTALFTSTTKGYVPASGTDATATLHADGTWSSTHPQDFQYTCTGAEGSSFSVSLPSARASTTYNVQITQGGPTGNTFKIYRALKSSFTVNGFTVEASAAAQAGDVLMFDVVDHL